jgi:hypothetical protein
MRKVAVACVCVAVAIGATSSSAGIVSHQIVGRWSRVTTCQELVSALKRAGLGPTAPAMLAGTDLVPGTPQQLARKPRICSGARPRRHSHFFTAQGFFGSLDWKNQQVDDGPYRVVDSRTLRIGNAVFHYLITGKQLALAPVILGDAKRRALANPLEFSTAGWQVAVSFPGHTWNRVPCNNWC